LPAVPGDTVAVQLVRSTMSNLADAAGAAEESQVHFSSQEQEDAYFDEVRKTRESEATVRRMTMVLKM